MEKLIVSMMRFSAAITLFGMEQLQNSMNLMTGGEDLSKTLEKFRQSLDSFSDAVVKEMDEKKRETLQSVTNVSEDTVRRTFEGMNVVDPREMLRATTDLMKKTSDSVADFMAKSGESDAKPSKSEPQKAAEVLSKSEGKSKEKQVS